MWLIPSFIRAHILYPIIARCIATLIALVVRVKSIAVVQLEPHPRVDPIILFVMYSILVFGVKIKAPLNISEVLDACAFQQACQ